MHETLHPAAPVRLCLLSYRHLSRLALGVIGEFADRTRIEIIDAAFDSALAAAHERERAGTVDAFVSAGSNAAILRGAVTRPTVRGHAASSRRRAAAEAHTGGVSPSAPHALSEPRA